MSIKSVDINGITADGLARCGVAEEADMNRLAGLGVAAAALAAGPALAQSSVGAPTAVTVVPFVFQTVASRNPDFDPSPYTYPSGDLAGQVNRNVGDVRLDAVSINGVTWPAGELGLVTEARVLVDD